ncbi:MAG: hypothetical protein M3Y13_09165, partial [Armatimonadota bacterium]|nr:hypothetical protein [Armatimonadota bacterium]
TLGRPDGSTVFAGGLDPRLPTIALGFEWLDPAAPPEASGNYSETLDFPDVPVPAGADQPVTVHRTLTTKHGTQVTLEKVAVRKRQPSDAALSETLFVLRCLPPPAVPDLYPNLNFAYPDLLDDTGKNLMKNSSYGSSGEDELDHAPGSTTLDVASVPSAQAKTLDVKISVQENAPSLRQEQWFRHLQFDLPLQSLPGRDAEGPYLPLATVASGPVQSTLESFKSQSQGQYEARLWLADAYDLQNTALHDDAGNEYSASEDTGFGTPLFWRLNGAPIQPGKRGHLLRFYWFKQKTAPAKLTLETEALPVRRVRHSFDLANLPLPKPGETLDLNRTIKDADGSRLLLRAISYFTDQKPLPGIDAGARAQMTPPFGLALALQFQSASGDKATAQFECRQASDEQGHKLTGRNGLTASSGDWLQAKESPANSETILLLPPSPSDVSSQFRVHMQVDETIPSGPARKLVFRDLAAPAPTQ